MRTFPAIFLFLFSLIIQTKVYSQVGIGTTSPDPSSMLDITSSEKGFLAPRMDTSERLAITTPAEGLMVFDTDIKAYYIFNNIRWAKLAEGRANYKLIQSDADLADELAAGGGTNYLLDTSTYYEINGAIVLAAPIDLNDAYISGLDANEDKLTAATGTIFSGANGGSIRNLTLEATGGSVFNLSGSSTQTLLFQNCIVTSSSSVGSISLFGVIFMNILQFVGNTDGITFANCGNVLLSNLGWFGNNGGTFETYTGSFSLIEKVSGFSSVPAGATGMDVSSNPTVTIGVLNSTSFSGAGTHVNVYTVGSYAGYFFTNNWNVDCPGIPAESDSSTTGYYYMDVGNTTITPFVTNNVAVKVAGTTSSNGLFRMSSTDNKLVYEGKEAREFEVICTGSLDHDVTSGSNGRIYNFFLYKTPNAGSPTEEVGIGSERRFSNNDVGNFSMVGLVNLAPGDAIEIYVSINTAAGADTFFSRLNVVLK